MTPLKDGSPVINIIIYKYLNVFVIKLDGPTNLIHPCTMQVVVKHYVTLSAPLRTQIILILVICKYVYYVLLW